MQVLTIATLLIALVVLCWWLRRLSLQLDSLTGELRELRLTSRARVGQAAVRSGAPSEERTLERLGRASSARRIVVGGDDDAEQKRSLVRQSKIGRLRGEDE